MKTKNLIYTLRKTIKQNKGFIVFIILMFFFRGAVADWYTIPSGSMQPTIEIGDRITVDKLAYDLNLPFTNISLFRTNEPKRGEIIVFDSKAANIRLIKRVIGVPGDRVSMKNENVYVNGQKLNYTTIQKNKKYLISKEHITGMVHKIQYDQTRPPTLANFPEVIVPEDSYLVLGDNRRNSSDSRTYGLVPRNELIGKANTIAFSINYDNYYLPKQERFWESLYN